LARKDTMGRALNPLAGFVITSSHNQPWYNGIKFYIHTGSQLVPPFDQNLVLCSYRALEHGEIPSLPFAEGVAQGLITVLSGQQALAVDAKARRVALETYGYLDPSQRGNILIAFDSMHGTGDTWTLPILLEAGYRLRLDPACIRHDGNFSTAPLQIANPEVAESFNNVIALARGRVAEALEVKLAKGVNTQDQVLWYIDNFQGMGIRVAVLAPQQMEADVAMTMDPDADRIGVAFRDIDGSWHGFNEHDEANLLTLDAKCRLAQRFRPNQLENAYATGTMVTTPLIGELARYYGLKTSFVMPALSPEELADPRLKAIFVPPAGTVVDLENFYVGFKNPRNFVDLLRTLVDMGKAKGAVLCSAEEGEGSAQQSGAANDKDSAVLLTVADQLALDKAQGLTPIQAIMRIYKTVGVGAVRMVPIVFEGATGPRFIQAIMQGVRTHPPEEMGSFDVKLVKDYLEDKWGGAKRLDAGGQWALTDQQQRDVVSMDLAVKSGVSGVLEHVQIAKAVYRPSGTEPKLKICLMVTLKPLGPDAPDEAVDEQRRAAEQALALMRRAVLIDSYRQAGVLDEVPASQHNQLLALHDFMSTGAKLGFLAREEEIWEKAERAAAGEDASAFCEWLRGELAKIGIRRDAEVLLGETVRAWLVEKQEGMKKTSWQKPAKLIAVSIWGPDKATDVLSSIARSSIVK